MSHALLKSFMHFKVFIVQFQQIPLNFMDNHYQLKSLV